METRVGSWRLVGEVGRGAMGVVHRALDPSGRPAALKLLLAGAGASDAQRRRFAAEVEALRRVEHPGVVRLLDAGEHQGCPWLAMEWVEGESLEQRLLREGPLDPRAAAELVRRVALALAHCHGVGLLHRDLKPGNLLVRAGSGEPLLTDFGLARGVEPGGDLLGRSALTRSGQLLGTPGYFAPELAAADRGAIGPRTDVFGLGALLHAALTGRPPNAGRDLLEVIRGLDREPAPLALLRPGVPAALDALCRRALARDPAQRPPSAAALADQLGRWLAGGRPATRPARRLALIALGPVALAGALLTWAALGAARPAPAGVADPGSGAAPTSAGVASDPAAPELAAGLRAWERGDPRAALDHLDRALELEPELAPAWANRGLVRARLGDPAGAEADLRRALQLAPADPQPLLSLVGLLLNRHAADAAEELLLPYLTRHPDDVAGRGLRGLVALERGAWTAAREDLLGWTAAEPDRSTAWFALAQATRMCGDLEGAERAVSRAVELTPEDPEAVYLRARVRQEQRRPAEALADLDRAVALAPGDPSRLLDRVSARLWTGDLRGGLTDARALAAALPGGPGVAHLERALAAEEQGNPGLAALIRGQAALVWNDHETARAAAEAALAHDPTSPGALRLCAEVELALERFEPARQALDRALAMAPDDVVLLALRVRARLGLEEMTGARADAVRAAELDPEHPDVLRAEADLAMARGELARAAAALDRALAAAPGRVDLLSQRARLRGMASDVQGGLADAEQATAVGPTYAPAWADLALLRLSLGQERAGANDAARALALHPGLPMGLFARAEALHRAGRLAEALGDLDQVLARRPRAFPVLSLRARVREAQGDLSGAVEDWERALAIVPAPDVRVRLERARAALAGR